MRRDKRPFVVEVKRGQKRSGAPIDSVASEFKQDARFRAEEALFGGVQTLEAPVAAEVRPQPAPQPAPVAAQPPRRILEALTPAAPVELDLEIPRRGRKPGSKNKPKSEAAKTFAVGQKRPRGRPPRNPEGQVRSVAATPELELAALQSIARTRPVPPISPIPGGRMSYPIPMFEPPPKRKRGRPRKIRAPKFDWTAWASDDTPEVSPTAQIDQIKPIAAVELEVLDTPPTLPALARFESAGPRLRAGERWKRRIRVPGGGPARPRTQNG